MDEREHTVMGEGDCTEFLHQQRLDVIFITNEEQILTENGSLHSIRLVVYCDVKIQQFEALNTTHIIYTTLIFVPY
jgi:hypothetical protein